MFRKNTTASIALLLLLVASSPAQQSRYTQTRIPTDLTKLWLSDGNVDSKIVVIYSQGGPASQLFFEKDGKSRLRYLKGYKNYHIVYLHQSQTFNPTILNSSTGLAKSEAITETHKNVEILDRAIQHFKKQGKKVIVIGNSYGGFIVVNHLATKSNIADQNIILAARIQDDPALVRQHSKGLNGGFDSKGRTFKPGVTDPSLLKPAKRRTFVAKQYLKWAIGRPNYLKRLKHQCLKNVSFFYGKKDQNVGALTEQEVKFLETKGVKLFATEADHYQNFYRFIDAVEEGKLNLIREDRPIVATQIHKNPINGGISVTSGRTQVASCS